MRVRSTARTRHGIPSERILLTGFGDFFRILLLLLVDAFTGDSDHRIGRGQFPASGE